MKLSDRGTAEWNYVIPADANLGSYYLTMQMGERYVEGTNFSVEDYKKPEYQVKVTAQTPRVLQGQPIKATIDARYYFGEPVANAKVTWVVHTSTYWPMGRDQDDEEGQHGTGRRSADADEAADDDTDAGEQDSENSGTLDADGKLQITIPTSVDSKKQDLVLSHRGARNRRRQSRDRGTRLRTGNLRQLLPDGRAELLRLHQRQHRDHYHHRAGLRQEAGADHLPRRDESLGLAQGRGPVGHYPTQGQTDASGKAQVKISISDSGEFRVRVTATTPEKRDYRNHYLSCGRRARAPWWSGPAQERVQIVADKKTYQPGDTAHVLIVTSKEPTSVLVTAEGNGLYSGQVIKSNGGSITVDVPIKPEYAPNFYVAAVFIRGNKLYQGSKSLTVPPTQHELNVQLLPSKPQYQPGEAASYTIKATDNSGKPVVAEFSLGVVDEAIYAIKPETVRQHRERVLWPGLFAGQHRDFADLLLQRAGGQTRDAVGRSAALEGDGAAEAGTTGAAQDPQSLPRHRLLGGRRAHRQQRTGHSALRLS